VRPHCPVFGDAEFGRAVRLLQIRDLIHEQLAETHVTPVDTQGPEQG
jgi:hypothetical protein